LLAPERRKCTLNTVAEVAELKMQLLHLHPELDASVAKAAAEAR
jgi:hypothetical protein